MKRRGLWTLLFGLTLGVSMAFARQGNQSFPIVIIAHRGASFLAPENTLASVNLAWDSGSNVEVDVHLTKDMRIVAIHDGNTRRTAGVSRQVSKTTYDALSQLDVGSFKDDQYRGERIPLLSEILATIPPKRKLFVELKSNAEILPHLERIIDESGKRHQIVIIGFNLDTITAAKKQMPDIHVYWLRATKKEHRQKQSGRKRRQVIPHDIDLIAKAKAKGLDGLDVHYAGVTKRFVNAVSASGLKLYIWTVDNPKKARRLARLGVRGITTNRPEYLMDLIRP